MPPINFAAVLRAFDAVLAFGEAVKGLKAAPPPPETQLTPTTSDQAGGQLEAKLTNVVVAALKEAFDRDHARLELEREHLEDQRKRAEKALRLEVRRQAVDRELARLRLVAGAAMLGWVVSMVLVAAGLDGVSGVSRIALAAGWVLLLGALGAAFAAQRHIGGGAIDDSMPVSRWAEVSPWLLVSGMALSAAGMLI